MSSARPAKRSRANSVVPKDTQLEDDTSKHRYKYVRREMLPKLAPETIRKILAEAAAVHPTVFQSIQTAQQAVLDAERAKVIDFDYESKYAWRALNPTRLPKSGGQQYKMAGEVCKEVTECIQRIDKKTPPHASFGTKQSALLTLRKIGKSICLACDIHDTLYSEVRKYFQYEAYPGNPGLADTMLRIAKSMSDEQRMQFMNAQKDFESKLVELEEFAADHSIFEDLMQVRCLLTDVEDDSVVDDGSVVDDDSVVSVVEVDDDSMVDDDSVVSGPSDEEDN